MVESRRDEWVEVGLNTVDLESRPMLSLFRIWWIEEGWFISTERKISAARLEIISRENYAKLTDFLVWQLSESGSTGRQQKSSESSPHRTKYE